MPELYYSIMNILDYIALNDDALNLEHRKELLNICNMLLPYIDCNISDLASANDCGNCNTWNDFINELKILHATGERI